MQWCLLIPETGYLLESDTLLDVMVSDKLLKLKPSFQNLILSEMVLSAEYSIREFYNGSHVIIIMSKIMLKKSAIIKINHIC